MAAPDPSARAVASAWPARLASLAVFAVALAGYRATMLPGCGTWDTAEFQTVPHVLGTMHAPGYPLYTLLGKLATWWPEGTIAWRLNVLSGACAAAAAAALVPAARLLGAGLGPAVAAALAFALARPVWETALRADPHTLHALLAVALVVLALAARAAAGPARARRLLGLGLLGGLALANQPAALMLVPGLALIALWRPPGAGPTAPGQVAQAMAAVLPGLALYAYLPLRARMDPPLDYGHPVDWPSFRRLVLAEGFHQDMGFFSLRGLATFGLLLGRLPGLVAAWLGPVGAAALAALGAAGLVAVGRRDARLAAGLVVAALVPLYWAATWVNGDVQRYYMAPLAIALAVAAAGLQALLDLAAARLGEAARPAIAGLAAVVALAPLGLYPMHRAYLDRSAERDAEAYYRRVLGEVAPGAVILSNWVATTPLWYGRFAEGLRPDVEVIDESRLIREGAPDVVEGAARLVGTRPVYAIHDAPTIARLAARYRVADLGVRPPFGFHLARIDKREAGR